MRAVVQRVTRAKVTVQSRDATRGGVNAPAQPAQRGREGPLSIDARVTGEIERGLLVLLGCGAGDTEADLTYVVDKIAHLRIFADDAGKMNKSVLDIAGGVLVVSQFTLYGDARQGRRPAFTGALEPVQARALYELSLQRLAAAGVPRVQAGEFAADMAVELVNDGPVTILIDSRKLF